MAGRGCRGMRVWVCISCEVKVHCWLLLHLIRTLFQLSFFRFPTVERSLP
jgi:hypothetical protein